MQMIFQFKNPNKNQGWNCWYLQSPYGSEDPLKIHKVPVNTNLHEITFGRTQGTFTCSKVVQKWCEKVHCWALWHWRKQSRNTTRWAIIWIGYWNSQIGDKLRNYQFMSSANNISMSFWKWFFPVVWQCLQYVVYRVYFAWVLLCLQVWQWLILC